MRGVPVDQQFIGLPVPAPGEIDEPLQLGIRADRHLSAPAGFLGGKPSYPRLQGPRREGLLALRSPAEKGPLEAVGPFGSRSSHTEQKNFFCSLEVPTNDCPSQ